MKVGKKHFDVALVVVPEINEEYDTESIIKYVKDFSNGSQKAIYCNFPFQ